MASRFVFSDVHVDRALEGKPPSKVEIKAHGVDQAGPSFEVRVFLDNPNADIDTPLEGHYGYAGSFHVYGFGLMKSGSESEPRISTDYSVIATDAVREGLESSSKATVTLVPRYYSGTVSKAERALTLDGVSVSLS